MVLGVHNAVCQDLQMPVEHLVLRPRVATSELQPLSAGHHEPFMTHWPRHLLVL